jgi:7,8-dihydro-6-hydroxymethylpterin-pyrophosphokinase
LMHLRKFVLVPMVQLGPDLIHPSLGMTVAKLLQKIPKNDQEVIQIENK